MPVKIITPKRRTSTGELFHNCPRDNSERNEYSCTECEFNEKIELLDAKYRVHCNAPSSQTVDAFEPPKAHDTVKGLTGLNLTKSPVHTWIEPKLDGARALVHIIDGVVHICSRRRDSTGQFREYQDNVPQLRDHPALTNLIGYWILDGEVIMDAQGDGGTLGPTMSVVGANPDHAIWVQSQHGPAKLWLFDVVRAQGQSLEGNTLEQRHAVLDTLRPVFDTLVRPVPHEIARSSEGKLSLFGDMLDAGYEGIVMKDPDASYGQSRAWLKLKQRITIDAQIVGWKYGKMGGKWEDTIGSLTVAVLTPDNELVEVADVIPGDDDTRAHMAQLLGSLDYAQTVALNMIVELEGQGWSIDYRIRHPRIVRFRTDRSSPNVVDFDTVQRI